MECLDLPCFKLWLSAYQTVKRRVGYFSVGSRLTLSILILSWITMFISLSSSFTNILIPLLSKLFTIDVKFVVNTVTCEASFTLRYLTYFTFMHLNHNFECSSWFDGYGGGEAFDLELESVDA